MTCQEFERVLPEFEGSHSFEQEEHLRTCLQCAHLVSDLSAITREASSLRATEEPNPRVWKSIEIALRDEGLIREPYSPRLSFQRLSGWRIGWLVPVAAALLVALGLVVHQRQLKQAQEELSAAPVVQLSPAQNVRHGIFSDEAQLLGIVAARGPASRAAYESDLRAVDAYIHDAELSAKDNPNDEIVQQSLMNAYEQKAMVYEMAMDRSLP